MARHDADSTPEAPADPAPWVGTYAQPAAGAIPPPHPRTAAGKRAARETWVIVLATVLALQTISLDRLGYARTRLQQVDLDDALRPADPLQLAALRWDTPAVVEGSAADHLRAFARGRCAGPAAAIERAVCLSNALATRCPHGRPPRSLLDPAADHLALVASHLAGRPCDPATRASLLAAALLATGTPARLVHMTNPSVEISHPAIEVHDPQRGWILFDPLFAGTVSTPAGSSAAAVISALPSSIHFQRLAQIPTSTGRNLDGQRFYQGAPDKPRATHLIYPDPWLYTRSGPRAASSPFNAQYVVAGPPSWSLGIGHRALYATIPLTLLTLTVALILTHQARNRSA